MPALVCLPYFVRLLGRLFFEGFLFIDLNVNFLDLFSVGDSFTSSHFEEELPDKVFLVLLDFLDCVMGPHVVLDEFIGVNSIPKLI